MDKNLSSVSEFCERNNISRTGFYREVRDGRLRVVKVRKNTRVTSRDEQDWLESLREPSTNQP
jgi:excisionase family DNA binding protein